MTCKRLLCILILLIVVGFIYPTGYKSIESSVEKHRLDNGATLLILQRPGIPIVSCISLANVGGVKEEPGITGISHFLEHLAFKGTTTIGTTDYESERIALEKCHTLFDAILEERHKGNNSDPKKIELLQKELEEAIEIANEYVIDNEFTRILDLNGGKNLNAGTSQDMTMYTVSLPSNKLELWMLMESKRFTSPVFREFYQEREVILEEKRMNESSPFRRFMNEFVSNAFTVHPYRIPVIGEDEDIRNMRVSDIETYFEKHYGAQNLVFAIVGDVDPAETLSMANKYLAGIPTGVKSDNIDIIEPEITEDRYFVYEAQAQPYILIGYLIPPVSHPDYPVYEVIADILGQGRSSRLHQEMVEKKKIAAQTFAFCGLPGRTHQNLFIIGVVPAPGVSVEDCVAEVDKQISLLLSENVNETELAGVKKRALKRSYDRLESRMGLALQLAFYESLMGDYRKLFEELKQTEDVSKDDIARVLNSTFKDSHRVIGELRTRGN